MYGGRIAYSDACEQHARYRILRSFVSASAFIELRGIYLIANDSKELAVLVLLRRSHGAVVKAYMPLREGSLGRPGRTDGPELVVMAGGLRPEREMIRALP